MQYQKDNQIFNDYEIKNLHPNTSFGTNTFIELGYSKYTPPVTPPTVYIPTVSARQMRLALISLSLLASVETAVAASDQATQVSWEYTTEFSRTHPLVVNMGIALGLTDTQIDDLFILAATL